MTTYPTPLELDPDTSTRWWKVATTRYVLRISMTANLMVWNMYHKDSTMTDIPHRSAPLALYLEYLAVLDRAIFARPCPRAP